MNNNSRSFNTNIVYTIAVVGIGLIGGSFALCCRKKNIATHIIGVDNNSEHSKIAQELNLVDEIMPLENALERADLIVLSIPVNAILETLPPMLDKVKPSQIIIDMGSTKTDICEKIKDHPHRENFVACHPMWGTEYSGPTAAMENAFTGKVCILCDSEKSNPESLLKVQHIFEILGMNMVLMNGKDHDMHTAYVSHISHITSFALANTVLEKEKQEDTIFELASAGFESTVRLAKSDMNMWTPIFLQNKKNVLEVLNEHILQLQKIKQHIENEDRESLNDYINQANKIRKILK
ncbi:MAG: prephenate dehydrogenase [Chitinophagaceae bacterium]